MEWCCRYFSRHKSTQKYNQLVRKFVVKYLPVYKRKSMYNFPHWKKWFGGRALKEEPSHLESLLFKYNTINTFGKSATASSWTGMSHMSCLVYKYPALQE